MRRPRRSVAGLSGAGSVKSASIRSPRKERRGGVGQPSPIHERADNRSGACPRPHTPSAGIEVLCDVALECRHNTLYCRHPSLRGSGVGEIDAPVSGPHLRGRRIRRVPILSVPCPGRFEREDGTAEGAAGSAGVEKGDGSGTDGGGERVGEGLRSRRGPRRPGSRMDGGSPDDSRPHGGDGPLQKRTGQTGESRRSHGSDRENGSGTDGGGEQGFEDLRSRRGPRSPGSCAGESLHG